MSERQAPEPPVYAPNALMQRAEGYSAPVSSSRGILDRPWPLAIAMVGW
jgi:hypothetical protein